MAPKLPGKFDDINKTATSVLGDDYQVKGWKFEAKQKTNMDGAVATVTVESSGAKDAVKTPAKLSWKFPKLPGLAGFAADKFEYDKDGKYKLECSMKKDMHKVDDLVIDIKHDLVNSSTVGLTYTGLSDALIKFETNPLKAGDFKGELLYGMGSSVIGVKYPGWDLPDIGVSFASGDLFASTVAKKGFSEFTQHLYYKVSDDVKVVATCTASTAKIHSWAIGGVAPAFMGATAKVKLESSMTLSKSVKKELAKGFTVIAGGSYNINSSAMTYGVKINVE